MDIRTPHIRTPYIGTPSIKARSVGASLVTGATKDVIATPVIALTGNSVTITCATTGATIYYTLDGSTPTSSSSQYSSAFTLDSSCTIKAIAIKGGKSSGIAEEEYVKPIIYLTQWKMMGNSVVHTDEYLTQWKVEGNSVVDNNAILSCGDLGQDGKYHVKISNGVTIYDIPLTEPLRKVNDVADTIEFVNGVATVTRNFDSIIVSNLTFSQARTSTENIYRYQAELGRSNFIAPPNANTPFVGLCALYNVIRGSDTFSGSKNGIASTSVTTQNTLIYIYDSNYNGSDDLAALVQHISGMELIYQCTPTTEIIQVSPFPVSPTDTYTSANDTPYSAFEYKKNVEIWSCGEYSAVDGKYHILVQPLGGSIVDIALDEPLRKVNDVADSIEYADGVGTLTRKLLSFKIGQQNWGILATNTSGKFRMNCSDFSNIIKKASSYSVITNILCTEYPSTTGSTTYGCTKGIVIGETGGINIYDPDYNQRTDVEAFKAARGDLEIIFELETPTTEIIQVPQIQEADSYSCVISQGGKAVSWSSFETE